MPTASAKENGWRSKRTPQTADPETSVYRCTEEGEKKRRTARNIGRGLRYDGVLYKRLVWERDCRGHG